MVCNHSKILADFHQINEDNDKFGKLIGWYYKFTCLKCEKSWEEERFFDKKNKTIQ